MFIESGVTETGVLYHEVVVANTLYTLFERESGEVEVWSSRMALGRSNMPTIRVFADYDAVARVNKRYAAIVDVITMKADSAVH